jgi:hypothetical protein
MLQPCSDLPDPQVLHQPLEASEEATTTSHLAKLSSIAASQEPIESCLAFEASEFHKGQEN